MNDETENQAPEEEQQQGDSGPGEGGGGEDDWAAALAEQAAAEPAAMQELTETAGEGGETVNLEAILDIPVTLGVQIGSTRIAIRNLLQLNQGSVVELDRLAGEPLDVLVNGTLVAHGEVVVVNEKYGIRLTDIISAQERVKQLG
ncbi:MAG: flagellar motor switch protein FliN [Gammaproteobacteria bacterium]|nr:MAG: flagellar motor switch protein FliN [Gammaproteobacteria bacterium]